MNEKILILKYKTIILSTISGILTLIGLLTPFYSIDSTGTEYGIIFNFYCIQGFTPDCPMVLHPDIFEIIKLQSWIMLFLMSVLIPIFGSRIFIVDRSEKDIVIPIETPPNNHNDLNQNENKIKFTLKYLFDASENKKSLPSLIKLHTIFLIIILFEFLYGLFENNMKMVYFGLEYIDYGAFVIENDNLYYFNFGIIAFIFATIIEIFNFFMVSNPKLITVAENKKTSKSKKEIDMKERYKEAETILLKNKIVQNANGVKI